VHEALGGAFPKRHHVDCGVLAIICKVRILGHHNIQVESTDGINTKIMLDSFENLYMMESNFIVNQEFQAEEGDAQGEW
jgi:hypothetical protein